MSKKIITMIIIFIFAMTSMVMAFQWEDESGNIHHKGKHKFDKPVIEKDSKAGPWKDSPNMGSTDPKNHVLFFDDFTVQDNSITANADVWLSSMALTIQDSAPGGEVRLHVEDIKEQSMQVNGESFQIQKNKPIYFEAKMTPSYVGTPADFFVGLMATDTAYFDGVSTAIGFTTGVSSTDSIYGVVRASGTEYLIDTGTDQTSSAAVRLGFSIDDSVSTSILMYVNDIEVAHPCTGESCSQFVEATFPYYVSPAVSIKPALKAGGTLYGSEASLDVEYIKVIQAK